ncbi:MAG: hypothetical protein OES79_14795 [Planctomycetota bacterium]|nr:hypothetical protein [Planctomycetota bacterium]
MQIVKAVLIFEDQTQAPHQYRIFETLGQCGLRLRHKQRVIIGQLRNERRRQAEIIFSSMARTAGTSVAGECLIKKDLFPEADEFVLRTIRRGGFAADEQYQQCRCSSDSPQNTHDVSPCFGYRYS